jgi:hypothetical protein
MNVVSNNPIHVQANAERCTFMNGIQGLHPFSDLMFIEMLDNLVVPDLGDQPLYGTG